MSQLAGGQATPLGKCTARWKRLAPSRALMQVLDKYTLADLLTRQSDLAALFDNNMVEVGAKAH